MPIPLLPPISLWGNRASFYDSDSVSLLELSSKLHASMNEIIDDYNKFVESTSKSVNDFEREHLEKQEVFIVALRQEFQDFIDTINLKVQQQDDDIEKIVKNITSEVLKSVNEAVSSGKLTIKEVLDESTETLRFELKGVI